MSTYTICLGGMFYAVAMDCDTIRSLDSSLTVGAVNSVQERNDAIRAVSRPMAWKDAYNLARRKGDYIGQLYAYEH